jgi:hypothetical protein
MLGGVEVVASRGTSGMDAAFALSTRSPAIKVAKTQERADRNEEWRIMI